MRRRKMMMKLNGSEKQIAWAKDIRENMLATLTELRDKEIRNLESARQKIADHESGKRQAPRTIFVWLDFRIGSTKRKG